MARQDCIPGHTILCKLHCEIDTCLCEIMVLGYAQPNSCKNREDKWVKDCFDTDNVFSSNKLCPDDKYCSCDIPRCDQTKYCYFKGGSCVSRQDCTPVLGSVLCKPYCQNDNCICEIILERCKLSLECKLVGDRCMKQCLDIDDVFCVDEKCKGDDRSCDIPRCNQTKSCYWRGGNFMARQDCVTVSNYVQCEPYCKSED